MANLNKWKWQYRKFARSNWGGHLYYKHHSGYYLRYPKTFNEIRNHDEKYSRARRKNIPDAWDDMPLSRGNAKSWKELTKRKRQYKNAEHEEARVEYMKQEKMI